MSRARKRQPEPAALPGRLGDVAPGDWAQLTTGEEVMVSWHTPKSTFVRYPGGEPTPLESSTRVVSVRARVRQCVADEAVVDPLTDEAVDQLPLFGGLRG